MLICTNDDDAVFLSLIMITTHRLDCLIPWRKTKALKENKKWSERDMIYASMRWSLSRAKNTFVEEDSN